MIDFNPKILQFRSMKVCMLFCNKKGEIFDHPDLVLMGDRGGGPEIIPDEEFIELPRGSDLMMLPGRSPIGFDQKRKQIDLFDSFDGNEVFAASAFIAPTFTQTFIPCYETKEKAPALPLYAYTPVGFYKNKYYVPCLKVDDDPRQNPWLFDLKKIKAKIKERMEKMAHNSICRQLEICALEYGCRAAQNYFLDRWEAPLPTSLKCNSRCLGCISLQPKNNTFKASHERVQYLPKPEEIAELAIGHIERVGSKAIVSFGQGCEGEPLLVGDILIDAIKQIRKKTNNGRININTNGSKPEIIEKMCDAGLGSVRVSINSAREELYNAYYNPVGYRIDDVFDSVRIVKKKGGHVSINLLVFPGVTDNKLEFEAVSKLIESSKLDMIQMRNLNIDPELYIDKLPDGSFQRGWGVRDWMRKIKAKFPHIQYGYFNPIL